MSRLSPWGWALAALGALVLHAGVAALAVGYMRSDDADELGAPAIEIGVEMISPRVEAADLPVGPNTAAAAPTSAVVPQTTLTEPSELPKAQPIASDDPERVVSPADARKPERDDPQMKTISVAASEQSYASEATVMPTIDKAPQAPRSVAPSPGTGASTLRQRATWQKELASHFDKFKRYPPNRDNSSAEVVVSFVLDRAGHVVASRIERSSGDASFDEAALAMLQRSDPVPPPPPLVADAGLTFTLPVIFHVRQRN
jgi:periplasmic protein TonB